MSDNEILLVAHFYLIPGREEEFKRLGHALFPLIKEQTGWQLNSVWRLESESQEVINLWHTGEKELSRAKAHFSQAFASLKDKVPGFEDKWCELLDTMKKAPKEEVFYASNLAF